MTAAIPATFQGSPSDEDGEPWLGYIRVSTWKEEKISPELQETAIRAWAARTGKRLLEPLIIDLDMTGRNFKRRIMGGIKRVEAGEARGIAVWKYSRFGRTRDGVPVNLKRLEDAGGQLASATEEVDARTATGRLQRGILFEFAAYESDVRGEQWKETHDYRRYKLHLPATGKRRFGYIWTPRRVPDPTAPTGFRLQEETYKADPTTGPVMADVYRAYVDGDAFYALVANLNDAGHRTLRGGPWTVQTLIRYMDSGFCAGLLRIHDPACHCPTEKRGNCTTPHLFIPGAQEELIDAELWQLYRERRAEIKKTPPRARRALYPLTNLVRCGGCRGTTPVQSVQRFKKGVATNVQGYSYACGKRATTGAKGCPGVWAVRSRIETQVLNWLRDEVAEDIDDAPMIPVQRASAADKRVTAARERARLEAEATKLATGLTNLRTQRATDPDEFEPGEYEAARDRIRQQQAVNRAAMERVATIESTPERSDYAPLLVELLDAWVDMSDAERNALLRQVVRRVALIRTDGEAAIAVHPVWEPDPWAEPVE
ncbi:recombinase family protein [Streptomyces salyersiae]|uniref:Recombinase family protein n=1 Tax=Streptomyces salyersiae TaxID=3075530 RepID=A0ABU2RZD5_9ACTN|nr:recombinase family protein [Streptomyces sp. DSM 41770]MDT0432764.1 recombinase family protein [Streptomyces sp. DSM 41770]